MLLADYQTEHLFLLVGENPLPNYVAARTLLKPGGMVYFVHSDRTKNQKDSLLNPDQLENWSFLTKADRLNLETQN